jgi:hypothetical protein
MMARREEEDMESGTVQQYEWALGRLRDEFGDGAVEVVASPDGRQVAAAVRPDPDREPYVVILRDPVLGNVNGLADPGAFLDAEIGYARAFLDGRSPRARSFG